jgi:hypothetical protein
MDKSWLHFSWGAPLLGSRSEQLGRIKPSLGSNRENFVIPKKLIQEGFAIAFGVKQ